MSDRVVIVGAGQAAVAVAGGLRRNGFSGDILVLGAEEEMPYERPPLSKSFLTGRVEEKKLELKPNSFFERARIKLRRSTIVQNVDKSRRQLEIPGEAIGYDRLVLATGASARSIAITGFPQERVYTIRSLSDSRRLAKVLKLHRSIAVIGGGYLGLEVARVAANAGIRVTVIEAANAILARSASQEFAAAVHACHESAGVTIRCGRRISGGDASGSLLLDDGARISVDGLVAAIGAVPNAQLGIDCGLALCDGAVETDDCGQTSEASIFAAGDVAAVRLSRDSPPRRIESVHNAVHRGARVASAILGRECGESEEPWFWSEQGTLLLQSVGIVGSSDEVVMATHEDESFTASHFRHGRLVAVECANRTLDFVKARAALGQEAAASLARRADVGGILEDAK